MKALRWPGRLLPDWCWIVLALLTGVVVCLVVFFGAIFPSINSLAEWWLGGKG